MYMTVQVYVYSMYMYTNVYMCMYMLGWTSPGVKHHPQKIKEKYTNQGKLRKIYNKIKAKKKNNEK